MYDDGCKVKKNARDFIRMRGKLLSSHNAIKNGTRIRKVCRLNSQRLHSSGVRGISRSDERLYDVLGSNISSHVP